MTDRTAANGRESPALAELEVDGVERGPSGTVPILRKKLDSLGYTLPLRQYLAKYSGAVLSTTKA